MYIYYIYMNLYMIVTILWLGLRTAVDSWIFCTTNQFGASHCRFLVMAYKLDLPVAL